MDNYILGGVEISTAKLVIGLIVIAVLMMACVFFGGYIFLGYICKTYNKERYINLWNDVDSRGISTHILGTQHRDKIMLSGCSSCN